ncbi:MAG: hypothetical protein WCJ93_09530 [Methanomicrobiales archaeon]
MKDDPQKAFSLKELQQRTESTRDAVKKALSRLTGTGKYKGAVMKKSHGYYGYDPTWENKKLSSFFKNPRALYENVTLRKTLSPLGARGVKWTSPDTAPLDPSEAIPKTGFPRNLVTQQKITWESYPSTGTEMIHLCADGGKGFGLDLLINVIHDLKKYGFVPAEWDFVSYEEHIESQKYTIECGVKYQEIEGAMWKAYVHGNSLRVEYANRTKIPAVEMLDALEERARIQNGPSVLRRQDQLELDQRETDQRTREIYKKIDLLIDRLERKGVI